MKPESIKSNLAIDDLLKRLDQGSLRKLHDLERRVQRLEDEMDTVRALVAQQIKKTLEH